MPVKQLAEIERQPLGEFTEKAYLTIYVRHFGPRLATYWRWFKAGAETDYLCNV